jgi:tetratricopeptide (TPR) repeat protein
MKWSYLIYAAAFALLAGSLGYGAWETRRANALRDLCQAAGEKQSAEAYRKALAACGARIASGDKSVDLVRTLRQRAFIHLQQRQYRLAIRDLDEAIRLEPDGADVFLAYYRRGQAHDVLGESPQAIADFGSALERAPEYRQGLAARALAYANAGDMAHVLPDYRKAWNVLPADDAMLSRQCEKALPRFREAAERDGKDARPLLWAAHCLMQLGRKQDALARLDLAIPLNDEAWLYTFRGSIDTDLERWEDAARDAQGAVRRDCGKNMMLVNNLCWARAVWGQELKEALDDCN